MDQVGASTQQIAHRTQVRVINVGLGEDFQPLQFGQVKSVALVVGVLDPAVLFDFGGIRQVNRKLLGLQAIDQPIPVEG